MCVNGRKIEVCRGVMKIKIVKKVVLAVILLFIAVGIGFGVKECYEMRVERETKTVCAEIGDTLSVAWFVGSDIAKETKISPDIIYASSHTNASVSGDGRFIYVGDAICEYEIIVHWINEKGKSKKERFRISTGHTIVD